MSSSKVPSSTTAAPKQLHNETSVSASKKRPREPEKAKVTVSQSIPAPVSNWAKLKAKVSKESFVGAGGGTSSSSTTTTPATSTSTPLPSEHLRTIKNISSSKEAALTTLKGPFSPRPLTSDEQRYLALDCEMVGVGVDGVRSSLAYVIIVDWLGRVIYSKHVKPTEAVTDYRTHVSGVRPEHLKAAHEFRVVQQEVADLVRGKVVVGHGLVNDMKALLLSHAWRATRDTALFRRFVRRTRSGHVKPRRLKHLTQQHLQVEIQTGEHDPAEDARAALALYKLYRQEWEHELVSGVVVDTKQHRKKEKISEGKAQSSSSSKGKDSDQEDGEVHGNHSLKRMKK